MKKKKVVSLLLVASMVASIAVGCVKPNAGNDKKEVEQNEGSNKITIMSQDTTFGDAFDEYIEKAEKATGLEIETVACPTNTDDRQAKITTILSSGDDSVDIITINDEMMSAFKNTGYLEPLQDTVMSAEILEKFPKEYMEEMTMVGENVYSVPCFMDILAFWVDEEKMEKAGIDEIKTKEDFEKYVVANSVDGQYGYGDAWEKTYVFNSIGTFVNLFGGDYYDWTNPKTQEAVKFMYDMMKNGETPIAQLADQYDPMMQKFFDGEYASVFMYVGAIDTFIKSGNYGEDKQHIAPMPTFENKTAYMSTWGYVLNSASKNKDASEKFLKYAASEQGELDYTAMCSRIPARSDVLNSDELEEIGIEGLDAIKEYVNETELRARPMAPQAMEFISEMGSLFQQYISEDLTMEEYCEKAQTSVDTYITE
ncbi:multiple sugar transport system substrate-binding protein [Aequitasia blattaphilus]|uniref:Extracellular solute-binding protein n=1 Tax=Aequitasia blattaphilus TaxID=2949332 RepID=A0ABT1E713_9FIRM|nr:extracellular solute-binding protein [Aequitasia blattaphilus]MCP1101501.1 extracellular solute-binding protein [Aequitasia blattaphilus]MCR8614141.1 extracellular solute-binding protein [Aequitasia blattaphilus]